MQRLDTSDIQNAGSFLSRELEQRLPGVYSKKYANLWAEEGQYIPVGGTVEEGATSVVEEIMEEVGLAAEMTDLADDVPIVSVSVAEGKFNIHTFILGYTYSVLQLKAMAKSGRNLNVRKVIATDRGLRQKVHETLVFGDLKRGSKGFFNNPNVPTASSSYDPNTSSFQDDIDFVAKYMEATESRNILQERTAFILVPNKLKYTWIKKFNTQGTQNVMQNILESFGTANGGSLRGIYSVNECNAQLLEQFGVKTAGTDEDRVVFIPESSDVVERLASAPSYMPPQLVGLNYKVCAYVSTSETIVHYPDAMSYVDIAKGA